MLTCPRHTVVVLEQTPAGPRCFLCCKVVEPIEVADPESQVVVLRPRPRPVEPREPWSLPPKREGTTNEPIFRDPDLRALIEMLSAIVERNPKDARANQRLGEVDQRVGDNAQAAARFFRVAEFYVADGFALRAVAVFKQVMKLDPGRVDVRFRLAELYQQLGLVSDAIAMLEQAERDCQVRGDAAGMAQAARWLARLRG